MNFEITITLLIIAVIFAAISFFMARKPKEVDTPWSIPWNGVMFLSVLVVILMISHLGSLQKASQTPLF